jgi:hypothetical protein
MCSRINQTSAESIGGEPPSAEAVRKGGEELVGFLNDKVLRAVQEAADNDEAWNRATREPREFLGEQGIAVPEDIQFVLLTASAARPATVFATDFCPAGLVPIPVRELTKVCQKRIEYWQRSGNPPVCWLLTQCLQWEWQFEERWDCGLQTVPLT